MCSLRFAPTCYFCFSVTSKFSILANCYFWPYYCVSSLWFSLFNRFVLKAMHFCFFSESLLALSSFSLCACSLSRFPLLFFVYSFAVLLSFPLSIFFWLFIETRRRDDSINNEQKNSPAKKRSNFWNFFLCNVLKISTKLSYIRSLENSKLEPYFKAVKVSHEQQLHDPIHL